MDLKSNGSHEIQAGQEEWDDGQWEERFHGVGVKYQIVSERGCMVKVEGQTGPRRRKSGRTMETGASCDGLLISEKTTRRCVLDKLLSLGDGSAQGSSVRFHRCPPFRIVPQ